MLRLLRLGFATSVLLAAGLAGPAASADSGLLSGSLGRWLDTEVLPGLGRMLGEHPRFKGETIRLVSLKNGRPTERTSRLHQAVQAHLTQRLLSTSGVRIAWTDQPARACGVSVSAVYLLGVEIERDGSGYHKLNIGMIDVAESVWVSGVNHTWRGRLTATEAAALGQTVQAGRAGTVDNPLPVHAAAQIADAMHRHLRCAHPDGLDGPVYLANAESPQLNRVVASLRSELATAPIAALTSDAQSAAWVLSLAASPAGTGAQVHNLSLLLTEQNDSVTQQVATVFISGAVPGTRAEAADTRIADAEPARHYGYLLSELRFESADNEGICDSRKARGNQCAQISFDLMEPAYLFVLSSNQRTLTANSCDARLVEADPGPRRFRLRVPPARDELPDAGLYAIAVRNRTAAKALARHIRTGVCTRPSSRSRSWLSQLDSLLAEQPGEVEWRAIHLDHSPSGVNRL